jgi:L-asparaginase
MQPKLIIHGGISSPNAFTTKKAETQEALAAIATAAYNYLLSHTALETVIYATCLLEDHPLFNAGTGSKIQSDGIIRMTASVMDGASQRFAGVINIQDVQNPVLVASHLLDKKDKVLAADKALAFARGEGFPYYNPETLEQRHNYEAALSGTTGTVGAVSLDKQGHLAAATSTGGKGMEMPGRVSDSATVAGNYATSHAAISCTGVGEDIVNCALAARVATRVADGMGLQAAVDKTIKELVDYGGYAGLIALDAEGVSVCGASHPYLTWAKHDGVLKGYS